jgi:hypothetical protein
METVENLIHLEAEENPDAPQGQLFAKRKVLKVVVSVQWHGQGVDKAKSALPTPCPHHFTDAH